MRGCSLLLALIGLCESACWSGNYLAKQGIGQLALLHSRRRIKEVLADPTVDAELKRRLALAWRAREFGVQVLGLRGDDAFTRFVDLRGQPVAWNVSAAPKDRLEPYVHRFPIVGAVPYLGFFKLEDARREKRRLDKQGFDTNLRGVSGYSTLGMTSDPIYSSMLEGSDARIAEVVLHEMLHGTVFLPGRAGWNESFATFVGLHGAAEFFAAEGDPSVGQKLYDEAKREERDAESFSEFLEPVIKKLEALYTSPISRGEKLRQREPIFREAEAEYRRKFPPPPGRTPSFLAQPLNNAMLLGYSIYHRATPEHERLFHKLHDDLPALIRLYKHAVEDRDDPIAYLKSR